jgi:hypothetical protein
VSVAGTVSRPGDAPPRVIVVPVPRVGSAAFVAAGVAFLVVLAAFVAAGGLRLEPTTTILILLMLGSAALAAAAAIAAPRSAERPLYGGAALLGFALLAAFTAISVIWSITPGDSWFEANRTFAYLAAFGGAIALARLVPQAWQGVIAGLVIASAVICGWALLTKVFPAALAADETFARLRAPFEYWNSVGFAAAAGVPPLLWLGARLHGNAVVSAFAPPLMALLLVCLMLSYSRGSLLALAAGAAVWFAAVPLRMAGLAVLSLGAAGAAPIVWWAFLQDGLTTDKAPMAARVDAGHELGALLLLVFLVLLLGGLALQFARDHRSPTPRMRTLVVRLLVGIVVLLIGGALLAAASADGGIDGQASKAWSELVDPNAPVPSNQPDRLTETSSVRARYFDEAFDIHALSPWVGTGAGSYAVARSRFRENTVQVRHAHGYVPQTLADLGWVGLGLSVLGALAWLAAALRVVGMRPRDRGLPYDARRIGELGLFAVVVAFFVHSTLDWTWFIPANMLAATIAAGWLAGSTPLRRRLTEELSPPAAPAAPADDGVAPDDGGRLDRVRAYARRRPLRVGAAALFVVCGLVASWTAFQPVRAVNASDEAFERLAAGAPEAAASIATIATERNPLSVDALFDLAAIENANNRPAAALAALERAAELEPGNPETWRRLGRFQLYDLDQPEQAVRSLRTALILDPVSMTSRSDVIKASRAAAAQDDP